MSAAACTRYGVEEPAPRPPALDPLLVEAYRARPDEPFPVPALDFTRVDPQWLRQLVPPPGPYRVGTIVVDPGARHLYLIRDDGTALRYGVGVGREGFGWSGEAQVGRKARWPTWRPPAAMIARRPELAPYVNGMPPGLDNPLGARAFYLFQGPRDTMYRIHGTNEPESIGGSVSSGCIRLFNQDIIDLYDRVPVGTRITVLPTTPLSAPAVPEEGWGASRAHGSMPSSTEWRGGPPG